MHVYQYLSHIDYWNFLKCKILSFCNQKYNFSIAVFGPTKLAHSLNLNVSAKTVLQSFAGNTCVTKNSYNYFNSESFLSS